MAKQEFKNNATGYLENSINDVTTTITLHTGQGALFPNPTGGNHFMLTIFDGVSVIEIVKCTARSTDVLTVVRAQEGTTGQNFLAGSIVEARVTKGTLENFVQKTGDTVTDVTITTADINGGTIDGVTIGTSTWNGNTVTVPYGGTGATTLTGLVKGNGTSPMTAATAGTDYSNGTAALATGILKSTTTTGALSIAVAGDFPTLNQNTTGSAATLTTPRSIYGNSFNGSADLTQVVASTYGGTGNGFTKFTGPTTAEKTFTLPNSNATLLYSGGALGTPSSGTVTNCTGPTIGAASSTHVHGNITNAGAIGTTATLPIITTTGGVLTTGAFGTTAGTFCQGNDSRFTTMGTTTNAATFNNSGTGGASGTTFNGSAAVTISYNTVGAAASGHTHTGVYEPADATILKSAAIGVTVQGYDADIPTVAASQAEMEAGTEVALRSMSPLRVAQAIAALGGGGWTLLSEQEPTSNVTAITQTGCAGYSEIKLVGILVTSSTATSTTYDIQVRATAGTWRTVGNMQTGGTGTYNKVFGSANIWKATSANLVICSNDFWTAADVATIDRSSNVGITTGAGTSGSATPRNGFHSYTEAMDEVRILCSTTMEGVTADARCYLAFFGR